MMSQTNAILAAMADKLLACDERDLARTHKMAEDAWNKIRLMDYNPKTDQPVILAAIIVMNSDFFPLLGDDIEEFRRILRQSLERFKTENNPQNRIGKLMHGALDLSSF